MSRLTKAIVLTTAILVVAAPVARALDFSPEVTFELSDTKVKANPAVTITVAQDEGEEEMKSVELRIPKGFKLPSDADVPNQDRLGTANITIETGPACNDQGPLSFPLPLQNRPVHEQDRTDEQADAGVVAVWVVDIRPVTSIPLELTGSAKKGWVLAGDIPANNYTCPPFTFDATIDETTASGVPIFTNPKKPGNYTFSATFFSADSPAVATIEQTIKITK